MRFESKTTLILATTLLALASCGDSSEGARAVGGASTDTGEVRVARGTPTDTDTALPGTPGKPDAQAERKWPEEDTRGMFVRTPDGDRFNFVPWRGEEGANQVFKAMKAVKGGEIIFTPGVYPIEQRLFVNEVPDLTISGSDGTILEFAPGPQEVPVTTASIANGAQTLEVDRPDLMKVDWFYQLYHPEGKGDRKLEFRVDAIEGNVIHLERPVKYMPHIKEIPAGMRVLEEVNIFRIRYCPRLVIQNLHLRGNNRGDIRGHTIYCGMYINGRYKAQARPTTIGTTIRGCTFRGFSGRGIAYYGIGDARIEGNAFYDIRAQAMEIDHFSSGHILGNYVEGAETGVTINDAFESLVEANVLRDCRWGIKFMRAWDDDWVNTGVTVRDNLIGPGCPVGIYFRDKMTGNVLSKNQFLGMKPSVRYVNAEGNTIEE